MKIILFGASGKTGEIFMNLALHQGHSVTAVVRDKSKTKLCHENLCIEVIDLSIHEKT